MNHLPRISIDTTGDTASVSMTTADGAHFHISNVKLGETSALTMDQVDEKARLATKEALAAVIAAL